MQLPWAPESFSDSTGWVLFRIFVRKSNKTLEEMPTLDIINRRLRHELRSMQRMIRVPNLQGVAIARSRSNHNSTPVPETPQTPTATRMLPDISLSYKL